jgi:hypothetical protein
MLLLGSDLVKTRLYIAVMMPVRRMDGTRSAIVQTALSLHVSATL